MLIHPSQLQNIGYCICTYIYMCIYINIGNDTHTSYPVILIWDSFISNDIRRSIMFLDCFIQGGPPASYKWNYNFYK